MSDHYPLFSNNDDALWMLGGAYENMGEQYTEQMVAAYTRIVRDYPHSEHVDNAKAKLAELNREIPDPDPERYELHKYNVENREQRGTLGKTWNMFGRAPDVRMAAKAGDPAQTILMPATPPGIRPAASGAEVAVGPGGPSADVSVETIDGPSAIDTEPDARQSQQDSGN